MSRKKKTDPEPEVMEVAEAAEILTAEIPEEEVITEEPEPAPAESVVYLGPTIPRVIQRSTVFSGGTIPSNIEAMCKKIPAMRALIIPVSQYAESVAALRKPGRLKTLYETVVKNL